MRSICSFLFLSIALTSCFTPRNIVKIDLAPDENVRWNYGRQVVVLKQDSLEAHVYFDDFTKKDLIFDVEIVNWNRQSTLISPEDIYLITEEGQTIGAYDPEAEIFSKQIKKSRDEAAAKNAAVAIGVATVATVVAVAATSDGEGGNDDDGFYDSGFVYINAAPPPVPLAYYPPAIDFWKDYSLRKTTLENGYKVSGKVVFPRRDDMRDFVMVIPVGESLLRANFRQRIFQP